MPNLNRILASCKRITINMTHGQIFATLYKPLEIFSGCFKALSIKMILNISKIQLTSPVNSMMALIEPKSIVSTGL